MWIVDPLFTIDRYPNRKNPKIEQPAIAIGQLVTSRSILLEREYEFQSFTGKQRIESRFFPDLEITVEEIVGFGQGI
ncbi:hypothetical protein ACE1CD_05350 [Aerosakkonema sp. BLCC-F183]|uniref:hypothetical protein n=1 Tax=Aerosakkonema sp. BLCC-F183 TaxID=3342834 RepID=UPI0035B992F3